MPTRSPRRNIQGNTAGSKLLIADWPNELRTEEANAKDKYNQRLFRLLSPSNIGAAKIDLREDRLWKSRGTTTHAVPIIAPGIINESRLKELADNRFIAIIPAIIAGVAFNP